jgi:hypothetical protein
LTYKPDTLKIIIHPDPEIIEKQNLNTLEKPKYKYLQWPKYTMTIVKFTNYSYSNTELYIEAHSYSKLFEPTLIQILKSTKLPKYQNYPHSINLYRKNYNIS